MRTISDERYPQLLLTSEQVVAAKALDAALDQPGIQLLGPIHRLLYALISAGRPEVAADQFLCPQILYLIYSNVRPDHVAEAPETISKCLSKLSWVIRGTAVYEALRRGDEYPDGLLG
jgi:hypothetical protein